MKTIMLYGSLGAQFGRVHRYDVKSPIEAIKALSSTVKGFKKHMVDSGYYRVLVGGKNDLTLDETLNPISDKETIRIVPVIQGAGGNFGRILFGAALIGLSFAFPYASATFSFGTFSQSISLASMAMNVGTSLVLSGVSGMLFGQQSSGVSNYERPENKPSFIFNGAVNTSRQGNPVPLAYGRVICGSQVISAGLSVEQLL